MSDQSQLAFMNYSHKNEELVEKLSKHIESLDLDIDIWKDKEKLVPGQSVISEIGEAISKSTYFVAVITKESLESDFALKEIKIALKEQLSKGYPIIIPILIGIRFSDLPKTLMLEDTYCITISEEEFEKLTNQIEKALRYYYFQEIEGILRIKGILYWDKKLLVQEFVADAEDLKDENTFSINISYLGIPNIKVIDPSNDEELDINIAKIVSEDRIELSFRKKYEKLKEVKIVLETKLDKNFVENIVEIEKSISKKELFGFRADIIIKNKSNYHIVDYEGKIETEPLKQNILQAKMEQQIGRIKKKVRRSEREQKLLSLIRKHKEIDAAKIAMYLMEGKLGFHILKHDVAFPSIKTRDMMIPDLYNPGKFCFKIDIQPGATISYQIIGPELIDAVEQQKKFEEELELEKSKSD